MINHVIDVVTAILYMNYPVMFNSLRPIYFNYTPI